MTNKTKQNKQTNRICPYMPGATFTFANRKIGRGRKNPTFVRRSTRKPRADDWTDGSLLPPPPPAPLPSPLSPTAEPGTGLLQGRQQILPHRAGQAGWPRRVPPHRHVHHAGEEPPPPFLIRSVGISRRGARASLGTESIILGMEDGVCVANRAVCLMCSQVCALQRS